MKIALLTMFNGLSPTYSLVTVAAEQLRMLLDSDIPVKMLVCQDCPDHEREGIFADERIEWIKVCNRYNGEQIHWRDYFQATGETHDTFLQEAEAIAEDLVVHLQDVTTCIMHDIHYQGWHLVHNIAIRKAQEQLPHVKFIAFTHSAPATPPDFTTYPFSARYTPMPNTTYAYPTAAGLPALAKQYNVPESECAFVHNSIDLLAFFSPDIERVHRQFNLLEADYLLVYPGRLTPAKKFEKVTMFAGALKQVSNQRVKVVFCDFPSMDIDQTDYKNYIIAKGKELSLSDSDILFTSDIGYGSGFPRSAVLELFTLSNVFVCPSFSESFGLTVIEAASRGNFLILNEAVPALQELGTTLHSYFMRWDARNFGYDTQEHYYPSEESYLIDNAHIIHEMTKTNPIFQAKTKTRTLYNPLHIWNAQLLPLLQ